MNEAANVLDRIARIRDLDRSNAPAGLLLGELRKLVGEAEAWARLEGDARARVAVAELGSSLAQARPDRQETASVGASGGPRAPRT